MKVLLLGATGNLGSRMLPALSAHGHDVVAYVRSPSKLRTLLPYQVLECVTVVEGDAFDSDDVAAALRTHKCEAVVNTAGTREPFGKEQTLGRLVASITSAAVKVGEERGEPLRAWIIGALGSLEYPGTGYKIQDYLPAWMTEHHRGTERVMKATSVGNLRWSLLCVAMMYSNSTATEYLINPRGNTLLVQTSTPPDFQNHWVRKLPLIGTYLNLIPVIMSYRTQYEEVADLIAANLARGTNDLVGAFVGFKQSTQTKSS